MHVSSQYYIIVCATCDRRVSNAFVCVYANLYVGGSTGLAGFFVNSTRLIRVQYLDNTFWLRAPPIEAGIYSVHVGPSGRVEVGTWPQLGRYWHVFYAKRTTHNEVFASSLCVCVCV